MRFRSRSQRNSAAVHVSIDLGPGSEKIAQTNHLSVTTPTFNSSFTILGDLRNTPFYIHCLFHMVNLRMFSLLFFILLHNGP